jgi:hypothetical protein
MCFSGLFRRFWPAESSPATEILQAGMFEPVNHYKNMESKIKYLIHGQNGMNFPMCLLSQ